MQELFAHAPAMTRSQAGLANRPTLELVAALLNGSPVDAEAAEAVQSATLARVRRHIDEHLRSPGLSAESITRDLGLSRARLYRVFEPLGGVATYIRKRRLRRCLKDLADPALRHRRISDIAWDWGFPDQASFSRGFRAEFGTTPREARGLRGDWPGENGGLADPANGDRRYEAWLRDLLKV
jgi:AraC-like DNA-binding protein